MKKISIITDVGTQNISGLSLQLKYLIKQLQLNNEVYINRYDENIEVFIFYEYFEKSEEIERIIEAINQNKEKHKVIQINHFLWNIESLNNITDVILQVRDNEIGEFLTASENKEIIIYKYFFQIENSKEKKDKEKEFVYLGTISEDKVMKSIFKIQKNNNIKIDFFGEIQENYKKVFFQELKKNNNLNYKGVVSHSYVNYILQEYKYYILNSKTDIFSISMLEQLNNGCIPFQRARKELQINVYDWNPYIVVFKNEKDFEIKYNLIKNNYEDFNYEDIKNTTIGYDYEKFEKYINYIIDEVI